MLTWLRTEGKLILASRGVRTFGYGFLSVILAIYLRLLGFESLIVGAIITATLLSGAAYTVLSSVFADRFGRRRMLTIFAVLMAVSGFIYAVTRDQIALIVGAIIGTLSPSGGEVGPFLSIEQAILPQTCPDHKRNSIFALYNTIGQLSSSAGALFSGLPAILSTQFNLGIVESYAPMFGIYSFIAIATTALYLSLPRDVELRERDDRSLHPRLTTGSRKVIARLSLLFGVDSFAGGLVLQSMISYWFYTTFDVSIEQLSVVFFLSGLIASLSYIAAGRLADRIGLINTMVFTHIPSSILLMLVPLIPTFQGSVAVYLARQSVSQMDIPTRQSYTVSVVSPEERTTAAGLTNISRNIALSASPSLSGYAMQFLSNGFPFFASGVLKIAYNLALYFGFRTIKPPEELARSRRQQGL